MFLTQNIPAESGNFVSLNLIYVEVGLMNIKKEAIHFGQPLFNEL